MTRAILVGGRRPATVTEAEWEVVAEELQFEALEGIRASAEKWVAAIAAILGIFTVAAVVKGPSDVSKIDLGWTIVVAAATAGAIGCAVWATYLASRAAYGVPTKLYRVGSELRKYHRSQADEAGRQLTSAIRYSLQAVALLALAVGILWFVTPREPAAQASVLVVTADGEVVCGSLQGAEDDSSISVKPKEDPARTIEAADVASVTAVASCP
jgi:hypothetical protein